ncbi:MAG TPA: hypothetical protein VHF22_14210, partial [Planctomycetota bacterium]|nr:hypothetical protein [Planctomycetota bacterium]
MVIHGAGVAPAGFCDEHAPVRVRAGDPPASAAIAEASALANPDGAASLYDLAAIRLRAGRFAEAADLARRAAAALAAL